MHVPKRHAQWSSDPRVPAPLSAAHRAWRGASRRCARARANRSSVSPALARVAERLLGSAIAGGAPPLIGGRPPLAGRPPPVLGSPPNHIGGGAESLVPEASSEIGRPPIGPMGSLVAQAKLARPTQGKTALGMYMAQPSTHRSVNSSASSPLNSPGCCSRSGTPKARLTRTARATPCTGGP